MSDDHSSALEYRRAIQFHEARKSLPAQASATFDQLLDAFGGPMSDAGIAPATVIERLARAAEPGLIGNTGVKVYFFAGGRLSQAAWDRLEKE